ncbi:MAG: DUF3226 domain-containing protein [Campylobacterota bacterium]|nr:DUF3226 domain-containing protein [Campylobacterota bacterium]
MKKYLLVEGVTDVALVKYICYQNGITNKFDDFIKSGNQYKFNDFIIINLKGQDNLENELNYLKDEEVEIEQIFIIQDADDDFSKSLDSIVDVVDKSNIDDSKIKYFLTPNNKDTGDLETLLLSTIQSNDIIQCFGGYKECLLKNNSIYSKALNKGQVYAYTMYSQKGENLHKPQDSFMHKFDTKYVDTNLWDLEKDEFKPIIKFILEIFKSKV